MTKASEATATERLGKASTVTIEGKTYALRMTHGVYIEAETITGISTLTDTEQYFGEKPTRKVLSAIFYALLKQAGADLTLDAVQAMVNAKNAAAIYQAVLAAHVLARAEEDAVPTVATGA